MPVGGGDNSLTGKAAPAPPLLCADLGQEDAQGLQERRDETQLPRYPGGKGSERPASWECLAPRDHHPRGSRWATEGSRTEQALVLALLSLWLRNGPSPRGLQGPRAPGGFGVGRHQGGCVPSAKMAHGALHVLHVSEHTSSPSAVFPTPGRKTSTITRLQMGTLSPEGFST